MDNREPQHMTAVTLFQSARQHRRRLVTTNYVLVELVSLLTSPIRISRSHVIMLVGRVRASSYVEVIHVDPQLDEQAWELLAKRQDKNWSLVDCTSFVVMQQRGITEALMTDHHFEQAGFIRLFEIIKSEQEHGAG
jgi:predicted nucleic acid-binding protein